MSSRPVPSPELIADMPTSQVTSSLSQRIARDICCADPSSIAREARDAAALRIIDTLGVALAGLETSEGRAISDLALEEDVPDGGLGAMVWGSGRRATLHRAVLANAVAAHVLDYDDSNMPAGVHAGSIVVPVALGLAERHGLRYRDVLEAIVCGYQTAAFLGRHTAGRFKGSASSTCGVFAAVVTAGRLLKVDADTCSHALGLAGSFASGTSEYLYSGGHNKPLQHGWAAHAALYAVSLAQRGTIGPRRIFEGEGGVFRVMGGLELTEDVLSEDLWNPVEVLRASTKPYPVCHGVVPMASVYLDILATMRGEGQDPFAEITRITCLAPPATVRFMLHPIETKRRPLTAHQARFSLPWCLGKLSFDGKLDLSSFDAERLAHPHILAVADKVDYEQIVPRDPTPNFIIGGLRVHTRSGKVLEGFCDEHWGGPTKPLTEVQLREKFLAATSAFGTRESMSRIVDSLDPGQETLDQFFAELLSLELRTTAERPAR